MSERPKYNNDSYDAKIVEEFRTNAGKVGGKFEDTPMLLLHTVGARTGQARLNPLQYQDLGGPVAIFASNNGGDVAPGWFHNVIAHADVTAEIGVEMRAFRARVAPDIERDQIWAQQLNDYPGFIEYEKRTTRIIPVVVLDPV